MISGNHGNGLRITDASGTVVQGNFFGPGANNTAVLGNRRDGILVQGTSAQTQVGGVIPLGNVSAGNGRNGIEVTGRASHFTTFNTFGGLLAFKGAAPNGHDGILITSSGRGNLVRTNVMSGNRGNGIELAGNAAGVTVDPDIAGLVTDGNAVLPNGGDGLLIDGHAHGNVIGGSFRSVIRQNTFSGNDGYGIAITGHAWGNRVFGAYAGPEILGRTALGNQRGGVLIGGAASRNVVGAVTGRLPVNLISGNHGAGVTLGRGTSGNAVLRNYIGRNRFGGPLPNSGPAIINRGRGNVIRGNRTSAGGRGPGPGRAPPVPVRDLLHRAAAGLLPPPPGGVAERDQRHRQRVAGQSQQRPHVGLVPGVQGGQRGAHAVGPGGQHELLHRAVDRRAQPRVARLRGAQQHRDDPGGRLRQVVGQVLGGQERRRAERSRRRRQDGVPVTAVGRLPALPVPGRDRGLDRRVGDHHPAPALLVPARRPAHRRVQDGPDDLVGDRFGGQVPPGRRRVQRVQDSQRLGIGHGHDPFPEGTTWFRSALLSRLENRGQSR